jgi:Cys-rich protein (TIGR01571 family)
LVIIHEQPPQGVKQGQQFVADVIRRGEAEGHSIPTGHWRDGCCNCFANGLFHPMLWLACCCRPLAVGQIMTRVGLSATGKVIPHENRHAYWSAFKAIACIFVVFIVVDHILSTLITPYRPSMEPTIDDNGDYVPPDYSSVPTWVWVTLGIEYAVEFAFFLYMLIVLIRTRAYVRQRYNIPEQNCAGCEDCCCAFWAPCCTTLQIARHTADYDKYTAACCSETGLPPSAPHVV